MTIAYFILAFLAILQRILYFVIPIMAIYGVVLVCTSSDIDSFLRSILLGLGKKRRKWILLLWIFCFILLGVILYDFAMWHRLDRNPFIQIPPLTLN